MNDYLKASFLTLSLFLALAGAFAQDAPPQPPHEVYGEVTDNGVAAEGISVEAVTKSNTYSDVTDSDGYYSIQVPSSESSFELKVDGVIEEDMGSISVESGSIESYDFSGDYIGDENSTTLTVDLDDVSVDEGETVDLEASVSNEGDNPDYDWGIIGDDYGASITDSDEEAAIFEAPEDVDGDKDVAVELVVETPDSSDSATMDVDRKSVV